jgi:hypothetical protein
MRAYRQQIRKPRPPGVPLAGRLALVRDFPAWQRSQGRSTLEAGQPWITFEATRVLRRQMPADATVFEYGSGGSTLYLAGRASELVSVEHDPTWYAEVRAAVEGRPGVQVVLAEPRPPRDGEAIVASSSQDFVGLTFEDYVAVVERYPDHHFDLLVVDGRARPSAFFRGEPKVKVGGLILLDDSERERYGAVVAAARRAGWPEFGRFGPKPFTPWFARTTVWRKTRDLESA